MSLTYSINPGTIYEAAKLADLSSMLNELPDNTQKLITPKDVRDSVFTTWDNIVFKPTTISSSSHEYIGIDGTYGGLNLREKIFFGKRQIAGRDIMSDVLLNPSNDVDIFIFNTKSDADLTSQNTKISFLAGTNSVLYSNAPYIQSQYVIGQSSVYLDFNIRNSSTNNNIQGGNINIISDYANVSINSIVFPTITQTTASASSGYVLKFRPQIVGLQQINYIDWEPIGVGDSLTSTATVSIVGHPVLVNGYPLEYTNSTPVPLQIGGILPGQTFSNVPLVQMLTELIYPYIKPSIDLFDFSLTSPDSGGYFNNNSTNLYSEIGNTTLGNFRYNYSITSHTNTITQVLVSPDGGSALPTTPINGNESGFSSLNTSYVNGPIGSTIFTMTVSDATQSTVSSITVTRTYPFFYGTSMTATASAAGISSILGSLTKVTYPIPTGSALTIPLVGNGVCIYLVTPGNWGNLVSVIDNNNFDVTGSFTLFSPLSLISPNGYWTANFKVYVYTAGGGKPTTTSVGGNGYTTPVNYKFNF